jgi:hypothetical protein
VCAAIVGILVTGYTGSNYFGSGDAYQLGSVAAVVVGTSIYGGRGGYGGTIAGPIIVFSRASCASSTSPMPGGALPRRAHPRMLVSYGRGRACAAWVAGVIPRRGPAGRRLRGPLPWMS